MDETELTPANENPWYIMMTIYGEQEEKIDWELAEKNSAFWNGWLLSNLDDKGRKSVLATTGLVDGFRDITFRDSDAAKKLFYKRIGREDHQLEMPQRNQTADLSETVFDRPVILPSAYFFGINAKNSVFQKSVNFQGGFFSSSIDFHYAQFIGDILWMDAEFEGAVYLEDIVCSGNAHFTNSRFHQSANFGRAAFGAETDFIGATFAREVSFLEVKFSDHVQFVMVQFEGRTHFDGAEFGRDDRSGRCRMDFGFSVCNGPTSFEHAKFASHLPLLTGATLHETTTFTVEMSHWPRRRSLWNAVSLQVFPAHAQSHEHAKASAAKLRHVMAKQALPEEEHFFFRREMHHAARAEPFYKTAHIYLFEVVSDFGYSINRPLVFLAFLWALGALFYWQLADFTKAESASYSFAAMFKFFGFQRTYLLDETNALEAIPWGEPVAATQTVLAFILLFFLGLGLRTRFRLR